MKLSLVVAHGVHTGKVIPISTIQFLIGRDPHCNLRPASPAVSKQHCGIFVRGEKVVLKDYGSTNGTCLNGEQLAGEREIGDGDKIKIGPLEFMVRVEVAASQSSTILSSGKKTAAANSATPSTAIVAPTPLPSEPPVAVMPEEEPDKAAAMLLSMDDSAAADPTAEASIPDGTTVMDIPAADVKAKADAAQKVKQAQADTSKAAADLLSKYMRRPRT
jgi:pSer/pThr/pTyr-binding forkhead associated (FHA) protein